MRHVKKLSAVILFVILFVMLTLLGEPTAVWAPVLQYERVEEVPILYIDDAIPSEYELPDTYIEVIEEPAERKPMVALTFDDGPSQHTDRILNVLDRYGGRATFFVLGSRIGPYRDTVIRAADLGNEIANHGWTHTNLTRLMRGGIEWEITATSIVIASAVGYSPPIMRPAFGATNRNVRYVAEELGYSIINWNVDTMDWRYRCPNHIYNVIMNRAADGSVILLHDIHVTTADAMERVIPRLIEEGFQLVTVSELKEYFYGELVPGRIYGVSFERN